MSTIHSLLLAMKITGVDSVRCEGRVGPCTYRYFVANDDSVAISPNENPFLDLHVEFLRCEYLLLYTVILHTPRFAILTTTNDQSALKSVVHMKNYMGNHFQVYMHIGTCR